MKREVEVCLEDFGICLGQPAEVLVGCTSKHFKCLAEM